MAAPSIPPRPVRSQNMPASSASIDIPQIPARPKRSVNRSVSPSRDSFARSPLNDPSFIQNNGKIHGSSSLSRAVSRDLPPRPPSVTLPSIGQEGNEYDHLTPGPEDTPDPVVEQTKNVAGDLPLHAPKASLPISTAKSRIAAVTRTDSTQAAAVGIGKANSETDSQIGHALARSTSSQASRSRPPSLYKQDTHEQEEIGIPVIGLQVPMYPNAGDVQAPTPSPSVHAPSTGVGFFSNGGVPTPRNHSRTKSGREVFTGPPGSYGLHGHGVNNRDPFEKAWYDKHPEAFAREAQGEYGPAISEGRKEWALSSDELNKLVHARQMAAIGGSAGAVGTPDEQIGYLASEEYASRMASPRPSSTKPRRSSSTAHAESPLRKSSFPENEADAVKSAGAKIGAENAMESEAEESEDVIHVEPPSRSISKVGGGGYDPPTQDLGSHGGNTSDEGGYIVETGYGVPILASDEIAHRPEAQYMQPAVEPEMERRGSTYLDLGSDTPPSGRRSSTHSRSNSIHNVPHNNLSRYATHEEREASGTPLEDVQEYEPLFPEDEEERSKSAPAKSLPTKLKRPDTLARHQFPSRDVWEDTPESLNYVTTVTTPQLPDDSVKAAEHEPKELFETPEAEQARKAEITEEDQQDFLSDSTKKFARPGFNADVARGIPTRPGMSQRFPSRDIWEDSPDSLHHTTTITPLEEEAGSAEASGARLPQVPARPARATRASEKAPSPIDERKQPSIPDKPKPHVPARPSKLRGDSSERVPLAKTVSAGSSEGDASAASKSKPVIPSRPAGGKIAALQAGFMSDLNKRLQLGPQAPKKEEVKEPEAEEVKAPLQDARKGRARGPQRRKPGVSPSPATVEETPAAAPSKPVVRFAISKPQTIWEVDESGSVSVPSEPEPIVKDLAVPTINKVEDDETELEKIKSVASASSGSSADAAVQTGQIDLNVMTDTETGETKTTTVYLGGRAPEPGTVVKTADGEEHLGEPDGLGGVEKTGHGM